MGTTLNDLLVGVADDRQADILGDDNEIFKIKLERRKKLTLQMQDIDKRFSLSEAKRKFRGDILHISVESLRDQRRDVYDYILWLEGLAGLAEADTGLAGLAEADTGLAVADTGVAVGAVNADYLLSSD